MCIHPGSRTLHPRSWMQDPGSWILDPGSWIPVYAVSVLDPRVSALLSKWLKTPSPSPLSKMLQSWHSVSPYRYWNVERPAYAQFWKHGFAYVRWWLKTQNGKFFKIVWNYTLYSKYPAQIPHGAGAVGLGVGYLGCCFKLLWTQRPFCVCWTHANPYVFPNLHICSCFSKFQYL